MPAESKTSITDFERDPFAQGFLDKIAAAEAAHDKKLAEDLRVRLSDYRKRPWGVRDSSTGLWMGDNIGPHQYTEGLLGGVQMSAWLKAQLAAAGFNERDGTVFRYQAQIITPGPHTLFDHYTPLRTFEETKFGQKQ